MENLTLNQSRAMIYRLLSACFYQPEEAFLEEDVFGQLEAALDLHSEDWAEQAKQLGAAFRAQSIEDLLLDYTRLFLGPYDILAKPYGSVYLDGEKIVMGDSTMNALSCYRQAEFDVSEDFLEMPDHVAVELEFLYLLTFKENEALARGDQESCAQLPVLKNRFLQEHLGAWIKPFCDRVSQGAQSDYYRLLAELTEAFVLSRAKQKIE